MLERVELDYCITKVGLNIVTVRMEYSKGVRLNILEGLEKKGVRSSGIGILQHKSWD